ncbi:MAG TPA: hypothetical protein VH683_03550 [Thermoleophilaceae bacterium]
MRLATALVAWFIALGSAAAAQSPPPCAPDKTMDVALTTEERGQEAPVVATHQVFVTAEISDPSASVSDPPDHVVLTPQAGVEVLRRTSDGTAIEIFAPGGPNLIVTASWQQSADPADPNVTSKCSASRSVTVPVLSARSSQVKLLGKKLPRAAQYYVSFYVRTARRRPNLAPIELTLRRIGRPRLPSRSTKALRWAVPVRAADRRHYGKHIPPLTVYLSTAKRCRFWYLSCGAVFSEVGALNYDGSILRGLPFSQPARYNAGYGVSVDVRPSGKPVQPFGFDIQARQGGKLIARYRRAGTCRDVRRSSGIFRDCRLSVLKNYPR